ncbi:MAG: BatA domain-containing protein [Verrucomicrobiota bacterium]
MNFLAPLFLAGALAVALPVVFHLIRRTTRERTVFSSLMFLQAAPPRLTRRSRLEHILLLLLRCAAICLLAAGFARPFVKHVLPEVSSTEPPKRIIVLVDTSASMQRAGLWSQVRDKTEMVLQRVTPADRVALYTFDSQLRPLVTFDEWNSTATDARAALARSRLADAKPSWAATRLDQAVLRAAELLSEVDKDDLTGLRQIVLVSDFQEGGKFSALQGQEWPRGIELVSERVEAKSSNAGLQLLADANETAASAGKIRVRVSNESNSKREQFQVGWAKADGSFVTNATDVYVPAGQSRVVVLPALENNSGADRIVLRGDDESFDNGVFNLPTEATRISVLYIGNDSATNSRAPLYFVRRALQETPRQTIEVIAKPTTAPLSPGEADRASMFIVCDEISEPLAVALREQAKQGKTVLFVPTSTGAAAALGLLLGQNRIAVEEGMPRNYAMLGEMDFRHPLFAPFADARYSDFTKVHFWKYRKLDVTAIPDVRIVARFDNGDAAIFEVPVGKGRVIVFASGWHPADSQLVLSTKFVPLLSSALELSGGTTAPTLPLHVGDAVSVAGDSHQAGSAGTVTLPDGAAVKLAAGETNFTQTTMPGIYQVKAGAAERRFAVNLDPAESRTAPVPLDELERLGVPTSKAEEKAIASTVSGKPLPQSTELENRQKLWRWFIMATLGVLLLETVIAGWTARRQTIKAEVAA